MTTEKDLRELDVRFAEEVLGCKVSCLVEKTTNMSKGGVTETWTRIACSCSDYAHYDQESAEHSWYEQIDFVEYRHKHYTRSLDAAWQAVQPICERLRALSGECYFDLLFQYWALNEAAFRPKNPWERIMATADHPAEAIVRAALEAMNAIKHFEEVGL